MSIDCDEECKHLDTNECKMCVYNSANEDNDDAVNNFEQIEDTLHTCRCCGFVRTARNFEAWTKKFNQEPSDMGEQVCDECVEAFGEQAYKIWEFNPEKETTSDEQ